MAIFLQKYTSLFAINENKSSYLKRNLSTPLFLVLNVYKVELKVTFFLMIPWRTIDGLIHREIKDQMLIYFQISSSTKVFSSNKIIKINKLLLWLRADSVKINLQCLSYTSNKIYILDFNLAQIETIAMILISQHARHFHETIQRARINSTITWTIRRRRGRGSIHRVIN